MQQIKSADIQYDHERGQIVGPSFIIKHVARHSREPFDDIFLYSSGDTHFFFTAERYVNSRPGMEQPQYFVDTKVYTVKVLGYPYSDDRKYLRIGEITDRLKELAISAIRQALFFDQSPFYTEPPNEVRIELWDGGAKREW